MANTKQCDLCSTLIPGTLCPSNVDKSTQPCHSLSSSFASTLLISNTVSDSLANSTDIVSSVFCTHQEKKDKVTSYIGTYPSVDYSNDYHTRKRIEQLHDRMEDIQISSFLKFINYHLSSKYEENFVKDLSHDLSNGHILIDLIEIFSSTKLKREHGHTRFHSLTNVQYVLDYLKLHMQHINISPHDIVSGNRKQILALLWIIMKIFDFPSFRLTTNKNIFNENALFTYGHDRSLLLKWINSLLNKIFNTNMIYIRDFYLQTWINNSYLFSIIKYLSPISCKYDTNQYLDYAKTLDECNLYNEEYLKLCLNLSNYCFNTIIIDEYGDRTEKCLLRYFSDLQQNVFFIIKTNQIGKLNKLNPFTQQLTDTIYETMTIDNSKLDDHTDDYLIFNNNETQAMHSTSKCSNEDECFNQEEKLPSMDSEENIVRTRKQTKNELHEHVTPTITTSSIINNDLLITLLKYFDNSKTLAFKYVLMLFCLCFSLFLIFVYN